MILVPQDARALAFDAASIKISTFAQSPTDGTKRSRVDTTPKSVTLSNVTLADCLQWAYNVKSFQVYGPDALSGERYDIRARVDDDVSTSQLRLMLEDLIAKRFQLALHRETKLMPVLELVIAKGGPKLPAPKPDRIMHSAESLPRVENGSFIFADTTMTEFAAKLSLLRGVELPVIDRTAIAGVYDITLKEAADAIRQGDDTPISIFLQEQLGLKLIAAKAPIEVLVIDRIGKLTQN